MAAARAALGVVVGPETMPDPAARALAAAALAEAGLGTVATCRPAHLAMLLDDARRAGTDVVLLDPARSVGGDLAEPVRALLAALPPGGAAVLGAPVTDTLKLVGADGALHSTADRDGHAALLTPMAFTPAALARALDRLPDPAGCTPDELLRAVAAAGEPVIAVAA